MKCLSIAIPASVVSDAPHLREKTSKLGLIGRTAAIFRVNEVIIYADNPGADQTRDMNLVSRLLSYMETPQYLRKSLFRLNPDLQYAGVLPPLRTPHHPLNRWSKDLKVGEYREGVVLSRKEKGYMVDIGVEAPALAGNLELTVGKRVTVRVTKIDKTVDVKPVDRNEPPNYWGYSVTVENRSFGEMVRNRNFGLTVATSKRGASFASVSESILKKWHESYDVLVAFGAPSQGLSEIVEREGLDLKDMADFVVNTIPYQGTETVRIEEALIASLAVLNVASGSVSKA